MPIDADFTPGEQDFLRLRLEMHDKFRRHIPHTGDVEHILLKGHLLIEHYLNELLKALVRPGELKRIRNFSFSERVTILAAFGLLPEDLTRTIRAINDARNELAHTLEFNVSVIHNLIRRELPPHPDGKEETPSEALSLLLRHTCMAVSAIILDVLAHKEAREHRAKG